MNGTQRRPVPVHVPVLADRVVELLAPALEERERAGGEPVVVDATLGLGGHAALILDRFPRTRVLGLDRDPAALERAEQRLTGHAGRFTAVHAVYDELSRVLEQQHIAEVQGVLFDLGVSSLQLDDPDRGFTYSRDVPLDMRMDRSRGRTAADVLNTYSEPELKRIFQAYGEERYSGRIAAAVVRERAKAPFDRSARLADLVQAAVPSHGRVRAGHPAKRVFQALRIEVNGELAVLERALPDALEALAVGGRIVVLAYHSLEDRLVKQTFAALARPGVPEGVPEVPPGLEPVLELLTRGAEQPTEAEREANPRAASARLRAARRVRDRPVRERLRSFTPTSARGRR